MFLNYFALGVLIFVFLVIFYGIIAIHDIPYLIAKKRNPEIAALSDRISRLEHQLAAEKKTDYSTFPEI